MRIISFLSIVLFIGVAFAASCNTAFQGQISPTTTKLILENPQAYNVKTVYKVSTSGKVEASVNLCDGDLSAYAFSMVEKDGSVKLVVDKAAAVTTTTGSSTTGKTPDSTVTNSGSRLSSSLLVVLLLPLFFVNRRLSIALLIVALCIGFQGSNAANTAEITVTISIPPSITSICVAGTCVDRAVAGHSLSVFGSRYSVLDFTYPAASCTADRLMTIPAGWSLAPKSDNAMFAVTFNGWNITKIVLSDGSVYESNKLNIAAGSIAVEKVGEQIKVACGYSVLIVSTPFPVEKEVISEPQITNFVTFNGKDYAVADNADYMGPLASAYGALILNPTDTTASNWQLAYEDDETLVAIRTGAYRFATECFVLESGNSYRFDLTACGTGDLVSVAYGTTGSRIYGSASSNKKILLRRTSTATKDSWTTTPSIEGIFFARGSDTASQYAVLDGVAPFDANADDCQAHFFTMPDGYSIASAQQLADFITAGTSAWASTDCFVVDGSAKAHDGSSCSASLLRKTVRMNGVEKALISTSGCGRVLLAQALQIPQTNFIVDMKLLILSPLNYGTNEPKKLAEAMMLATGIPYEIISLVDASGNFLHPGDLPLWDDNLNPRYYGIITTGQLVYQSGSSYPDALTTSQKQQLALYKRMYSIREVNLFTPSSAPGLTSSSSGSAATGSLVQIDAGVDASWYKGVKAGAQFTIGTEFIHLYTATTGASGIKPVLQYSATGSFSDSKIAAAVITDNGVETMQFFFAQVLYHPYGSVLANMWLNWVTKGAWLGQRRVYLSPQVDDLFLSTEAWDNQNKLTRMTDVDLETTNTFIKQHLTPIAPPGSYITLEFGFNGAEASTPNQKLLKKVQELRNEFFWESHTWSHEDLTCPDSDCPKHGATTYDTANQELLKNIEFTRDTLFKNYGGLELDTYSAHCMITPKISGLFNPNSLKAMVDNGINCVVGDNSVVKLMQENPYRGEWTSVEKHGYEGVFIIPRFATAIYYDSQTWQTAEKEYNSLYGPNGNITNSPYRDMVSTMPQILQREAEATVKNLGVFRHDPYMFHQGNLYHFNDYTQNTEQSSWSLMTLWLDAVVRLYSSTLTFPLKTVAHKDLLEVYFARRERDDCGLAASLSIHGGKKAAVHVTSTGKCVAPVTGLTSCTGVDSASCSIENYGPDSTVNAVMNKNSVDLDAGNTAWNL